MIHTYVEATLVLDRAAGLGDLTVFQTAEVDWADAAEAYADDLKAHGHFVPVGLREHIKRVRDRVEREQPPAGG